ncbi:MAG TPA: hypothetical protein VK638_37475, partial [Edaphobacter sp.]|nr:hypothetical protein [Edaphobacter sp.]
MSYRPELYACLYVREFPAQALSRLRPKLREKPFVVMEGEPPSQTVCSLNSKARNLGVVHGMTKVEIDTFPAMVTMARSLKEEDTTRAAVLECADGFSPRIEDRSDDHALTCVIDIAGTEKLFGPPRALAQSLLQHVRALGIAASVTVSSNFHAAICLARGGSRAAVSAIAPGDEGIALAPLPLAVL